MKRILLLVSLLLLAACNDRAVGIPGTCGDGVLDSWEECDGVDLGGVSCFELGFEGGDLQCDGSCQLEPSGCTERREDLCGDGVCQPAEDPVSCPADCTESPLPTLPEPWGTPGHWWLLAHPNYTSTHGPGIHLIDTNSGELLQSLPLPASAESPHGLAAEADRVWLSDMTSDRIYIIRVSDGEVEETLSDGRTEGLARTTTGYWAVKEWNWEYPSIRHNLLGGLVDQSFDVDSYAVNDLAYDGRYLYYVVNDGEDPIYRVDPLSGVRDVLVPNTIGGIYTLAYDGEALVIDSDAGTLRRYDRDSGELIEEVYHGVQGWITAIAPAWGQ